MNGGATIEFRGVRRRFGSFEAVAGLDFTIERGEIFGLLGPNGAGKTTTIRMLMGLLQPSAGEIRIDGHRLSEGGSAVRKRIGWVPQAPTLDPLLTGRELLTMVANLYEVPEAGARVAEALAQFKLTDAANQVVGNYSGGMKKRLELAAGTIHRPGLLVLDEPTTGLDVETRHQLWELIRELNSQGTTVVITTHYLDEADMLCNRVAIIDRGRVRTIGAPARLKQRYGRSLLRLTWDDPAVRSDAASQVADLVGPSPVREVGSRVEAEGVDLAYAMGQLLPALHERGVPRPDGVECLSPSLDQVFARVTGRNFDAVTGTALGGSQQPEEAPAAPSEDEAPQAALPSHRTVSLREFLRHNRIFWLRWWWRMKRDPVDQAISVLQPVLWLLLFGQLWQAAIQPDWAQGGYLRFMMPGAVMMTVFNAALMAGLDVLVDRERGALDRFLASPVHPMALVTSRFAYITTVSTVQTLSMMALAALLGVDFGYGLLTVPGLLLLAALLGAGITAASLALAFAVKHHGQFYTLTGLVSLPLIFLSSVFAPVEVMPAWLRALAVLNPMTHAVGGARQLILGGVHAAPFLTIVGALLAFGAVMLAIAHRSAKRFLT